ncbi:type II toxin-antitoxin system VapC family toxin [Microbispora sp. NPDC049125]|uniref:type II toxin-antitoxin system VapC family toxin n=1 Tax=Microbispora sp. NPDC049125 TaxID=3154929 RepID=UPI003465ED0C
MMVVDVNVYINAFRPEADRHKEYRLWLEELLNGAQGYGVADFAINAFVRVVTNPRTYKTPAASHVALSFAGLVRNQPHATVLAPGRRHWEVFTDLCHRTSAVGKLIPDAYLAALAIEHGCEFITCDKDFRVFPGLRTRHPLN